MPGASSNCWAATGGTTCEQRPEHPARRAGGGYAAACTDCFCHAGQRHCLPDRQGAGPGAGSRTDPERPVQRLRAAGGSAVCVCRQPDERRFHQREAVSALTRAGRAYARRSGTGEHRGQRHLFRHERQCHCRRRRPGTGLNPSDAEKAAVLARLCRRRCGGRRHHWSHHSTVDSDGDLRAGLRHVGWRPLSGRGLAGLVDCRAADARRAPHRNASQHAQG